MNSRTVIAGVLAAWLAANSSQAQDFDLNWYTLDGGGAMFSTGGSFSLGSTIGQSDAGVMSGGTFTLTGGYWAGAGVLPCELLGDFDHDGATGLSDLAILLAHFGAAGGADDGDLDDDGDVDLQDLATLLSVYGTTCP